MSKLWQLFKIPRSRSLPAVVGCTGNFLVPKLHLERIAFLPHMFAQGQIRSGVNSTALSGQVPKSLNYSFAPND